MPDIRFDAKLKTLWLRLKLLAIAMLVTSIIYLIVCLILAYHVKGGEFRGFMVGGEDAEVFRLLRVILLVLSFPFALAAFWTRGFAKRRKLGLIPTRGWHFPDTPEGRALARLMPAMMVSMAVAESPGIFGLVTFFIMGGFAWLAVFLAISFSTKLLLMPSLSEFGELIDEERREAGGHERPSTDASS